MGGWDILLKYEGGGTINKAQIYNSLNDDREYYLH